MIKTTVVEPFFHVFNPKKKKNSHHKKYVEISTHYCVGRLHKGHDSSTKGSKSPKQFCLKIKGIEQNQHLGKGPLGWEISKG